MRSSAQFLRGEKKFRCLPREHALMNEPSNAAFFSKLVEEHHGSLILYARQFMPEEAEDIVQEAFLQFLRHRFDRQPIDNPVAWLFRVVRNEAISRLRRRTLLGRRLEEIRRHQRSWFEANPSKSLENSEIAQKIAEMPLDLREVLVPRLWGELSFQEIGELTETSESTAHRHYVEALKYLKNKLQ